MSDADKTIPAMPVGVRLDSLVVTGKFKDHELAFAVSFGDLKACTQHIDKTLPSLFFALWQAHHVRQADAEPVAPTP